MFLVSLLISDQEVVEDVLFPTDARIHLFAGKMLYSHEAIHHIGKIYNLLVIYICIRYFTLVGI
jgi:hypothetical protein